MNVRIEEPFSVVTWKNYGGFIKANIQPFCGHKEMAIKTQWHGAILCPSSFSVWLGSPGHFPSHLRVLNFLSGERRGGLEDLQGHLQFPISCPISHLTLMLHSFLPIHFGRGVFKCSLTTQPFLPSQPQTTQSSCFPETPFCQRHPELKDATQAVQVSHILSPPSGARRSWPVFN